MTIELSRDSVCMGDDVMAPNAGCVEVSSESPLGDVLREVSTHSYLASVSGGATWSVWPGEKASERRLLAVLHEPSSSESTLKLLLAPGTGNLRARDLPVLYFRYHLAEDPGEVLYRLQQNPTSR